MRRNRFFRCMLAGLWIGILFVPGCGKKGDPILPRVRLPAAIADLSAASSAEGMILRWSIPFALDGIGSFRILRSDTEAANACPGCPQDHRTLVQLSVADGRLATRRGKGDPVFRCGRPTRAFLFLPCGGLRSPGKLWRGVKHGAAGA